MLRWTLDPSLIAVESGIYEVNTTGTAVRPTIQGTYSLSGVRMDSKSLKPGLYIVNGKKVLVK